jgi:hypothetical protein
MVTSTPGSSVTVTFRVTSKIFLRYTLRSSSAFLGYLPVTSAGFSGYGEQPAWQFKALATTGKNQPIGLPS